MSKKQIVRTCGYVNIHQLCKVNTDICIGGKAPSRKQLIKFLIG